MLNVLVALGGPGPAKAPVSVVARCVDALATIGMRDEARAIAAEAVLLFIHAAIEMNAKPDQGLYLEAFLEMMSAERGASVHTLDACLPA